MLFPLGTAPGPHPRLALELDTAGDGLPVVLWTGLVPGAASTTGLPRVPYGPGMPLLGEHAHGLFTRPHLRGHRLGEDGSTGRGWSTRFVLEDVAEVGDHGTALRIAAHDRQAGLGLVTELESVPGGALRVRHTLTNTGAGRYLLEGLEVVLPVDDRCVESLDFTGRHERERTPQRRTVTDGLWLRESRAGRPGLDAATMLVLGTPGFSPTAGAVVAAHVAWSGNSVLRVERDAATATTLGGGELLQPGEVALATGEAYTTPWVCFAAADDGLDGLAAVWHAWQRALPAHPEHQPVVLNVWEAVYFDHDLERLHGIAERAARVGVERFVLDDGWFRGRRDDTAGLGDWWVDEEVWPDGLDPLIDRVRGLGMEFGLWFEPEMVNPDSDLYRAHPDWVLATGDRVPLLHRHQLVLDLTRPEVFDHLLERVDAVLSAHPIGYVKWDHNRDLLEAGSGPRGGAPAVHEQTTAFYRLLDELRARHPRVAWESCASGGGRIDLGVLERVQRVWTSDMTDALARQQIQRWTTQLLAPEYVGAHVSSPTSHTTGRTLPLDFRAATALFGAFGIEWDLTRAGEDDLDRLADWVARFKRLRPLLHSGRVVRPESADPAVLLHGVVAADRSEALMAHVQLEESAHNRGVAVRVPGLDPDATYHLAWEGPVELTHVSMSAPLPPDGPTDGVAVAGRVLADRGFWLPRRRPETVTLVRLTRA
ncbi:alpha-galactosidase [Nocardioides panaciterrulae]|uniref:alpha-galactosidase n=1 Tax=Nocardioides panaciterrulae TaxID=661492 RepID=A0A7Y9E811_9ACTN|nr:alpha-galactosidase [Nocardioides panaciterrulae]NYD42926.1 alpha-galactosidase [Nocardioides panaciterrulae]